MPFFSAAKHWDCHALRENHQVRRQLFLVQKGRSRNACENITFFANVLFIYLCHERALFQKSKQSLNHTFGLTRVHLSHNTVLVSESAAGRIKTTIDAAC